MAFDIIEGCIWFAIVVATELPQAVSLASFITHMFFPTYLFYAVGARDYKCER